jgi:hypothetical protein
MLLYLENKWFPGDEISVAFRNGNEAIKKKVRNAAMSILEESKANINFKFIEDKENARVRIFFGAGTVTQVGMGLLNFRNEEANGANLTFLDTNADGLANWMILHEFGHVLGMVHEIFHPYKPFSINYDEMWKYYRDRLGSGLNDKAYQQVFDANIGSRFLPNELQYFDFDKDSIMMYEVPPSCNDEGINYSQPGQLSDKDKELLKIFYPEQDIEIKNLDLDKEKEGNLIVAGQQDIYKFVIKDELDSTFVIKTSGSESLALSLFTYSKDEKTKGYLKYIKPKSGDNYHNESEGTGAIIELSKTEMPPELREETDFYVRIRHLKTTGTGKYNILVKDKYK